MNTTTTYNDGQGHRDRAAFAVLISADGAVTAFTGTSIPKLVAVTGREYVKNGKWSNTTYSLTLAEGVRLIKGTAGFASGLLSDGVASSTGLACENWADLAAAMGADLASVDAWLRSADARSARTLDERAAALAAL